jgi:hydroxymethylpyrimidine pyrophosphatase-like HAD family hydrolase
MVTTSYVHQQAYQELLDDGHPIVLVTGRTIIDLIFDRFEIRSVKALIDWLDREFS